VALEDGAISGAVGPVKDCAAFGVVDAAAVKDAVISGAVDPTKDSGEEEEVVGGVIPDEFARFAEMEPG